MLRYLAILALAGGLMLASVPMPVAAHPHSASAATFYTRCGGSISNHGKRYKVSVQAISCGTARPLATSVLRTSRAPRGWRCSLSSLRYGAAACKHGGSRFAINRTS